MKLFLFFIISLLGFTSMCVARDGASNVQLDAKPALIYQANADTAVKAKDSKEVSAKKSRKLECNSKDLKTCDKSYVNLDSKMLVANVSGSKKVMQVTLSLMTLYEERVTQNIEKNRLALRAAALNVLQQVTEPELTRPDFYAVLSAKLRDRLNKELERIEGFGGIEEIFFSEFVLR